MGRTIIAGLALMLLLAGCGEPRGPITTRAQARADHRPLEVRVLKVHESIRMPFPTEGSHLIEVEVLGGDAQRIGQRLTLPYDEWQVGKAPPGVGETATIAPAQWVEGNGSSRGKPMRGWEKP